MDRLKIIDHVIKQNTKEKGYSNMDNPIEWDINALNQLGNVVDPDRPGITFEYTFYLDLSLDFLKTHLTKQDDGKSFVNENTNPRQAYNVDSDKFDVAIQTVNYPDYGKDLDDSEKCYIGHTQPKVPSRTGGHRGAFKFNWECRDGNYCFPDRSKVSSEYFTSKDIMSHYDTQCRYGKTCGQYRVKGGCVHGNQFKYCNIRGGKTAGELNSYGHERTGGYDKYSSCIFEGGALKSNKKVPTHGNTFRFTGTAGFTDGCNRHPGDVCKTGCRDGLDDNAKKTNSHEFSSQSYPCIRLKKDSFSTPTALDFTSPKLLYNSNTLPLYKLHYIQYYLDDKKSGAEYNRFKNFRHLNNFTWEIKYRINYSTKTTNAFTCLREAADCNEIIKANAINSSNDKIYEPLNHMDIYHLLQFVSNYPLSNGWMDTFRQKTIKLNNLNNAYHIMMDFCYFNKKNMGLLESFQNVTEITPEINFCSFNFQGGTPDILINARNFEGEQVELEGIDKNVEQSDANFVQEKMDSYQNNDEFQNKLLGSYPQSKYIFLNYCRGNNFNSPECLNFYRGMFKKANEDGGNLDEDIHEHIKTMCYTKDKYVSDDKYFFTKKTGDTPHEDIVYREFSNVDECKELCEKTDECVGFVMNEPVVTFYKDADFKDSLGILSEGSWNNYDMTKEGITNDKISSVDVPDGLIAILYEHGDFNGDQKAVSGKMRLSDINFNEKTSSVKILQFDCEAYKERYPSLYRIYGGGCMYLQNHFMEYGIAENFDASGNLLGKGCWLKKKIDNHQKNMSKSIYRKEDTDSMCSCFYKDEYYQKYLSDNNYPIEASREGPKCWFPKCFGGIDVITPDPNKRCSDLTICNNEIQTILRAGGDIKNVNINTEQFSQCNKVNDTGPQETQQPNPQANTESNTEPASNMNKESNLLYIIIGILILFFFIMIIIVLAIVFKPKQKQQQQFQRQQFQRQQFQQQQ